MTVQKVIEQLKDVIGHAGAIAVCRRWGGRELRVPVKVAETDPLALTLGLDMARKLVQAFGDQRLQLPAEVHALRDMRNEAIWRACTQEGRSMESVGLEFGLTRPGVSAVLRRMREQRAVPA